MPHFLTNLLVFYDIHIDGLKWYLIICFNFLMLLSKDHVKIHRTNIVASLNYHN